MQADGSEEKGDEKVMVADLALYKKLTIKSSSWVGHLKTILVHRGGHLSKPIFKSLNGLGVVRYFSYAIHYAKKETIFKDRIFYHKDNLL